MDVTESGCKARTAELSECGATIERLFATATNEALNYSGTILHCGFRRYPSATRRLENIDICRYKSLEGIVERWKGEHELIMCRLRYLNSK
jgi:hypothetical protein